MNRGIQIFITWRTANCQTLSLTRGKSRDVHALYRIICLGLSHSYFQEPGQKKGTLNCVSLLPSAVIHKCYEEQQTLFLPGTHSIPAFSQPRKSGNV